MSEDILYKTQINNENVIFRYMKLEDININYFKLLSQLTVVNYENINEYNNVEFFKNLQNSSSKIVVIEYNSNVIGTASIFIEYKLIRDYGKVAHIEDVVIDKDYRGYGLGKTLIQVLLEIVKKKECYKCILNCSDKVKPFYISCGLDVVGVEMAKYFKD